MDYQFETEPFEHQLRIFNETAELTHHGLLWEQGCGKTKPLIDQIAYLYEQGKIDAALIVAPGGVERNWVADELPKHLPKRLHARTLAKFFQTRKSRTKWHGQSMEALVAYKGLSILCISYSGFMSAVGKRLVWKFLKRRRVFYVLDESDEIKTPKAKRTRSIVASGKYAEFRRIATGTPADQPFDIYSQLRFLDPQIWARRGMKNFAAFKQHFGVWWTRAEAQEALGYDPGYDKLVEYKNLDELAEVLAGQSDRLLKEDVLDLPDKLYTKIRFDMTPRQQSLYDELREEFEIELEDGRVVDGNLAITRLLRLQQITCGYMVTDAEEPIELCDKTNPRLDATVAWMERLNHAAIIWCRFRHDIDQLVDALGERAVRYDGAITDDEAELAKNQFNAGDVQYLIGNPDKGARGLTMNIAKTTGYYSNSFKLRFRLQSEDRNHRFGQDGTDHGSLGFGVLYGDVMANGTVDGKIVQALRDKFDIASALTGDRLREWI